MPRERQIVKSLRIQTNLSNDIRDYSEQGKRFTNKILITVFNHVFSFTILRRVISYADFFYTCSCRNGRVYHFIMKMFLNEGP